MKALCWYGKGDVRVSTVTDPRIEDPRDAIVQVTATAICGSDLHLLDGYMPGMESGDVLGHEFMGVIVELGTEAKQHLAIGDRVIVPFNIACGECLFCKQGLTAACERSNRNRERAEKAMGHSPCGMFGYSHVLGGYAGGQAELVRVPFADFQARRVPDELSDEQVLFLTDILPTGYMAAENAQIEPGATVAVWGCGPVGQFAMQSAWLLGAGRVIGIDRVPERLQMARDRSRAETIDFSQEKVYDRLQEMTGGLGPSSCIDAVGCEAHAGGSFDAVLDKAKAAVLLATDRLHALREAIMCCRKAGTVSVPGVYVGYGDHVPLGAFVNKGLTLKTGQTHVHRYVEPLLKKIKTHEIDPTAVITHRLRLDDAPEAYKKFRDKEEGCVKVVLRP